MRGRILALGAAFGLFGCTAVLGLDERPLDPNADGGLADAPVTSDSSEDDTLAPEDTLTDDALVQDVEPPDTAVGDTTIDDATVGDTAIGDTTMADTRIADTTIVDTAPVDTGKGEKDTSVAPDTFVPDTAVMDTGADTSTVGLLTVTHESLTGADVNLTAEGTLDWAHWGKGTTTAFNHRIGISFIQKGSATGSAGIAAISTKNWTWSDGTPTMAASTTDGLVFGTAGEGYTFTVVPSPTVTRTLYLYVGWYNRANGGISAALSDGSAASVVIMSGGTSTTGVDYERFVITFRSGTPTATLTIKAAKTMGPSLGGSLDFFAATLH